MLKALTVYRRDYAKCTYLSNYFSRSCSCGSINVVKLSNCFPIHSKASNDNFRN